MRKLLLVLMLAALSSAPLSAQTRLPFSFFEDTYNPDPAAGVWYAYPDLRVYARVNSSEGIAELASDARYYLHYFLTADRFGNQDLAWGNNGWDLGNLQLSCIGEGRDGFLYGEGYLYGTSYTGLFKLDPAARSSTFLMRDIDCSDLASDVDGTLYGISGNQLLRIDTDTGAKTLVTVLSQAVSAFGISHDGRFWGIETVSVGFSYATHKLYQLDPVSGNVTFVMDLPNSEFWNVAGMASEAGPHQPMNSVHLSGPYSAIPGSSTTFNISAAPPSSYNTKSTFMLVASQSLGLPFFGGQPFELSKPLYALARGQIDVYGAAVINLVVPGALSGRTIFLEAGVRKTSVGPKRTYDSNMHPLVVL